ncbi:MAG TPA: trypsin-like peptidase domain-containing protein [Nocardioidaceae bacterium]|nr:trypsin-like peptidase domain-containing protein [Nocardioidaceae bacterium]
MNHRNGLMRAYCHMCGARCRGDEQFCPRCGHPLETAVRDADRRGRRPLSSRGGRWFAIATVAVLSIVVGVGTAVGVWTVLPAQEDPESPVAALAAPAVEPPTTPTDEPATSSPASSTPASEHSEPMSDEELVRRFGSSVFRVEVSGCTVEGSGTAFAIDEHHVVTNFHVVAVDTRPTLVGREGESFTGRVVGWREDPDVAVIRVDETLDVPAIAWADSEGLNEGQHFLALGYPVPATDFSATPGSILSFQRADGRRQAVRSDAALDKGNSGGPALDERGRAIGVVTQMALNGDGFQLVPLIFTHDALRPSLDAIMREQTFPDADCVGAGVVNSVPDGWDAGRGSVSPASYGDDPLLDHLWDKCADGDMASCDQLYQLSPFGSEYERFGSTCGDRNPPTGYCVQTTTPETPRPPGPAAANSSWIVVIQSLEDHLYTRAQAEEAAAGYRREGIAAAVLLSSDYGSLNAGYWVVYTGPFATEEAAAANCRGIRTAAPSCYQRELRA